MTEREMEKICREALIDDYFPVKCDFEVTLSAQQHQFQSRLNGL